MSQGVVEESLHRALGLTDEEYQRIQQILGREPNRAELAMYSVMWSEHCSYKSSRIHLRRLPSEAPHVLMGPGEGAGVIEVDGVAVALRIESHNHPSFVEPFQGAATGVGGIVRDVLSVGARPIALLDSLRFGPLPTPDARGGVAADALERNRVLFEGVVSGVSSYGNCIGVPTVGGEVKFEECYSGNPLVNVMCVGVAPIERIRRARAEGVGNKVILLGSPTGRDGIGGVSVLASAAFGESSADLRPSVQVGDPFTEKLLIETCLELMDRSLVVGIQDLGGAGLCCATSETAAHAGTGMRVHLEKVPRREEGMEPFEVLTSESQERMLVIASPEDTDEVLSVCERWGLSSSVIGEVVEGGRLEVYDEGMLVADVPAASLGDGPVYERPMQPHEEPVEAPLVWSALEGLDAGTLLLDLLGSTNIASKRWVWEQYDHQVMLGTVVGPGHDAAVLRIEGTPTRIAVTTDGNGRYCLIDPRVGTMHAVAEAARNISVLGAEPKAITNCLNFGNPERAGVMWEFSQSVDGMAEAAHVLGIPVTGGNVSFYNETDGRGIYPTPIIGMIGTLGHDVQPPPAGWRRQEDVIFLLGDTYAEFGGGELALTIEGLAKGSLPRLDLSAEARLGSLLRLLVSSRLVASAHDCSEGGLAVALAESCIHSDGLGVELVAQEDGGVSTMEWLFSESASRVIISVDPEHLAEVEERALDHGVPIHRIGRVAGSRLVVSGVLDLPLSDLKNRFDNTIPQVMGY